MESCRDWTWNELLAPEPATPLETAEERSAREEARREEARREAWAAGMAEGRAQGLEEARRELAGALAVARKVMEGAEERIQEWLEGLDETLSAVGVGLAGHLAQRELEVDPSLLESLVHRALGHFPTDQAVRIRVSPDDLDQLAAVSDGDIGARDTRWIADESLAPGSFVLEGPERVVDGRLDQALERIFWKLSDG